MLKVAIAVTGCILACVALDMVCRPESYPFLHYQPAIATADPDPKTYSSADFKNLIIGKSKREIIAALGTPLVVNDGISPGSQTYNYSPAESFLGPVGFRVRDDETGITQRFVQIEFDASGSAVDVHY